MSYQKKKKKKEASHCNYIYSHRNPIYSERVLLLFHLRKSPNFLFEHSGMATWLAMRGKSHKKKKKKTTKTNENVTNPVNNTKYLQNKS